MPDLDRLTLDFGMRPMPLASPRPLSLLHSESYVPETHYGTPVDVMVHPDGRVFIGTYGNTARIVLASAHDLDYQLHHAIRRSWDA